MRLIDWVDEIGRTPVVPLVGYPGLFLTDVSTEEALKDSQVHARTVEATAERFHPDAVFTIMDLTVEAEAVGLPIVWSEKAPPSLTTHPVKETKDLKELRKPDPEKDGRMPVYLDTVTALKDGLKIPLGAYVIGPFTLAGELAGAEKVAMATITDTGFVEGLLEFTTEVIKEYASALGKRGANIIAILEPTSVVLSPGFFDKFSLPWVSAVAGAIRKSWAFPVLHICGNTAHLIPGMAKANIDGLSLDSPVDIPAQIAKVPPDIVLIGNVDPVGTMLEGTVDAVRDEATRLVAGVKNYKNFILSSGCDLALDTPPENIDALIEVVR